MNDNIIESLLNNGRKNNKNRNSYKICIDDDNVKRKFCINEIKVCRCNKGK